MPFGLANAPSAFMRTMAKLLKPHDKYVLVFMDDILVFSKDGGEVHEELVQRVLETLHDDGWHLNPKKCLWGVKSVGFLGHTVDKDGIRATIDKVRSIQEMSRPRTVKQVRKFLGMTRWYSRFIDGYASVAAPLHDLTGSRKSHENVQWTGEHERAFRRLKQALTESPILAVPEPGNGQFEMYCDASKTAIGAVLT